MLYAFGVGEVPISISGDLTGRGPLMHTIRAVGAVTQALCALRARRRGRRARAVRHGWPLAEARRRRRRRRRRRPRPCAAPAGVYALLDRRDDYGSSRSSTAPGRREDLLYPEELERWRARLDVARATSRSTRPAPAGTGASASSRSWSPARAFDPRAPSAFVCGPEVMMRFVVRGARASAACRRSAICVSLERNMQLRHRPLRPLPARPDARSAATAPSSPPGRDAAAAGGEGAVTLATSRSSPSGSSPRATAASSRCSTARTSCSRSPGERRDRLLPRGDERPSRRPVRRLARRGLDHDRRTTPSGSRRCARSRGMLVTIGACATAGRHPGAAQLRRRRRLHRRSSTRARSTSRRSRPRRRSPTMSTVDFELRGCPIRQAPAARVGLARCSTAAGRGIPRHIVCVECKARGTPCVMVAHGTPVPRPGDAGRLRRDLPGLRPRLLRLLRPDGDAEHRGARGQLAGARRGRRRLRASATFNATRRLPGGEHE